MTCILRIMALAAVFVAGAICAFAVAPDASPRAQWARFDAPPVIDGRLDDPCWKQATRLASFRLLESGEDPKEPTEAFLGYDGTNLYLAFRMRQAGLNPDLPLGPQLTAVITERDGKVQQDDSIEIFLNPVDTPEARHTFYRFAANALGTQADAYGKDAAWDGYWQVRIAHARTSWTMEIVLPLCNFQNSAGRFTKSWRMNLFRTRPREKEYTAWSPALTRSFHVPERFGIVDAPDADMEKYAHFKVTGLTFHDYDPEQGTLQARLAVQNNTSQSRTALVAMAVALAAGAARTNERPPAAVPARGAVEVREAVALGGARVMSVSVWVRDPVTREVLAFMPPVVLHPPQAVSVRPGLSYYTREPAALAEVCLGLGKDALAGAETTVELRNGTNVVWRGRAPACPRASFTIPLTGLTTGSYTLVAGLVRAGAVVDRADCELVKLPGADNEVKFNARQGALVGGELFLPYGITHVPEPALPEVAKMGFNCVMVQETSQHRLDWNSGRFRSYLDAAHTNGLKVILGLFHAGGDFKETFRAVFPRYLAGLPEVKDHPALLAWYTVGEPGESERDEVVRIHNALKNMDPYHPTFPVFCMHLRFTDGWDVGCADTYWSTESDTPQYVARLTDAAMRITAAKQCPFWIVPQAGIWSAALREPTPPEQRCQTYLALIHGARGIIYFRYKPLYEPLWEEFGRLAREVQRLTPILLDSEPAGPVSVQPVSDKICNIHWLLLEKNGRRYLLAANAENKPVTARFSLSGIPAGARVAEFFENRELARQAAGFDDDFTGYGTHVYEISGQP